jgi:SAM-dependent methyltransferase
MQRRSAVGMVVAFLKQALELVEDPARAPGWVYTDPGVLQTQGQSSAAVPPIWAQFAPSLEGLEAALAQEGARILDDGSGVGWLSISACRVFPAASVVGLDPWEPAQELARANIAASGFSDRITLQPKRLDEFEDNDGFDLIWVPTPFISLVDSTVERAAKSLRPGGWIVLGLYAAPDDPLAQAISDLRTVRGGGTPMSDDDAVAFLDRAGLEKPHAVERTWRIPLRFVVGRKPTK